MQRKEALIMKSNRRPSVKKLRNHHFNFVTRYQPRLSARFDVWTTGHHLWSVGLVDRGLNFLKRSEDLEHIIVMLLLQSVVWCFSADTNYVILYLTVSCAISYSKITPAGLLRYLYSYKSNADSVTFVVFLSGVLSDAPTRWLLCRHHKTKISYSNLVIKGVSWKRKKNRRRVISKTFLMAQSWYSVLRAVKKVFILDHPCIFYELCMHTLL